jgi:galactokinase
MVEEVKPTSFEHIRAQFTERWGRAPTWIVRCPGRVNLIGF